MGLGIAQAFAASRRQRSFSAGATKRPRGAGATGLLRRCSGQVARGRLDPAAEAAFSPRSRRLRSLLALQDCDLVIESAPEDRAVKNALLARIEKAAPEAILASTTSGLTIGGLAKAFADPSRLSRPALLFSGRTACLWSRSRSGPAPATRSSAGRWRLVRGAGKRPIVVRDGPGFFATRVFAAYLDEAVAMATEGIAIELIEAAHRQWPGDRAIRHAGRDGNRPQSLAGPAGPRGRPRTALLPSVGGADARVSWRPVDLAGARAAASSTGLATALARRGPASSSLPGRSACD